LLAADFEIDRADASDRDWSLTCYCEDVSVEGCEALEPILVDGNVYICGRREYPIIAR